LENSSVVENKGRNGKLLLQIFVLGMCWALAYVLGFIQYMLYDPFKETLGCTNKQLGLLMTIFGLGNIFGAPIGGWLADRFDYKKIYTFSLVGNGILSFIFAMNMTYKTAVIIWIGLAITTLVMNYPSHIKILRVMAGDGDQTKIFGLNEVFVGVADVIINAVFLYVFARFVESRVGIRAVVLLIGVLSMIFAVAVWFVLKDIEDKIESEDDKETKEKITVKDFFITLKSPETWLLGIGVFSIYSLEVTMSYFTPYMTGVLGGSVALAGILSLIRIRGLRLIGAPFGGLLSRKTKSVSKALVIIYVIGIITLVGFMKLPIKTPMGIFIFLTLIIGFISYMGKGIYYAVDSELDIPKERFATTVGIAAALGFSPDVFQFTLAGYWLDKYGNAGYSYLFIFQIAVLFIGVLASSYIVKRKKKLDNVKN
jgi:predicted MFS family arabinose efflux permease